MQRKLFVVFLLSFIASSASALTRTWTGGVNNLWSVSGNWSPAGAPAAQDALNFPAGPGNNDMVNDLPADLQVAGMTFGQHYELTGNRLVLYGDVGGFNVGGFTCNADLKIAAPITMTSVFLRGALDVNGQTIALRGPYVELRGPVNGSGTINCDEIAIRSSGSFAGEINGIVHLVGSMPNANVTGVFTGDGTIGTVHVPVTPVMGDRSFDIGDPLVQHALGTLNTRDFTLLGDSGFDINAAATSDSVHVTGSVTLSGLAYISLAGVTLAQGQSIVIIDNDGSEPINGAFSNYPEGYQFAFGGATVKLTYHGGDGNDVALICISAPKTWTGAVSNRWSDAGNWQPAGAPLAQEPLLFPSGGSSINDLPADTAFGPMRFNQSYTISGNRLLLMGDLTFVNFATFQCDASLKIGASLYIGHLFAPSRFSGSIDVNGKTLTVDMERSGPPVAFLGPLEGSGTVVLPNGGGNVRSSSTYPVDFQGIVNLVGAMPNASVVGSLNGDGSIGAVTVPAASFFIVGDTNDFPNTDVHVIGTFNTKNLSLAGHAYFDIPPTHVADAVHANGSVTLSGPLHITAGSIANLTPGDTFTIIDNDGTDPVIGRFSNVPEGGVISDWFTFRVTYAGGTGNDVVLTVVAVSSTGLAQNAATTRSGESARFTATVTPATSGTVRFADNGTPIGDVPLVSSVAVLNISSLTPGPHDITAKFLGAPTLEDSTGIVSHTVVRGDSATTLSGSSPLPGQPVSLTIVSSAVAPAAGAPTGNITIEVDGVAFASVPMTNGAAVFTSDALSVGGHNIRALYAGDANFNGSASNTISVTVAKAPTSLTAAALRTTTPAGTELPIGVTVVVPSQPSVSVSGTITVSENGKVIAQQTISGSSLTLGVNGLTAGTHDLLVSYLGNNSFEASSASISVTVLDPTLTIADASVAEGNDGTKSVTVFVHLSAPASVPVAVSYATHAITAKEGEDFAAANGTLTFAPGETTKHIDVTVYGDTKVEDDESFGVTLSQSSNATIASGEARVTIVNDDLSYHATTGIEVSNGVTIDVYTPVGATGALPLIVWIPGTAAYDPDNSLPPLRETARGFVVATAHYRGVSTAPFPAAIDDLKAIVRYLRANAARFNVNPDRIALWGRGTGAHLASLLGTTGDTASANSLAEGNPALSNQVQLVIDWGGATDIEHLQSDSPAACNPNYAAQLALGSGASPIAYVNSGDASFLIVHGADDCTIPVAQSQRFYDALRAANVYATLRIIDGVGAIDEYWFSPAAFAEADAMLDQLKKSPRRRAAR